MEVGIEEVGIEKVQGGRVSQVTDQSSSLPGIL